MTLPVKRNKLFISNGVFGLKKEGDQETTSQQVCRKHKYQTLFLTRCILPLLDAFTHWEAGSCSCSGYWLLLFLSCHPLDCLEIVQSRWEIIHKSFLLDLLLPLVWEKGDVGGKSWVIDITNYDCNGQTNTSKSLQCILVYKRQMQTDSSIPVQRGIEQEEWSPVLSGACWFLLQVGWCSVVSVVCKEIWE